MASTLTILTIAPAVTAVAMVIQARRSIRGTGLELAWKWSLAASLSVLATWLATGVLGLLNAPWNDMAWYCVAVLLLCPLIAVLGARRPGVAVWNWFVVLPLLAVLGWPVAAAASYGGNPGSLILDSPHLLGIVLVLVMGCGNYLGTRFQASAVLLAATVILLTLPLASVAHWPLTTAHARLIAVWCTGGSALLAWFAARCATAGPPGPDRVWRDFRDQFGIVWANRIQDRVNERAVQEAWPVRLERAGFAPPGSSTTAAPPQTSERVEHTLRWLLRRFVDDEWIDARLD